MAKAPFRQLFGGFSLRSLKSQLKRRDKQPSLGVTQGGSNRSRAAQVAATDGEYNQKRDLFKPGAGGWGF